MATLGDLYRQADALRQERIGELSRSQPNYQLQREIEQLASIMQLTKNAFLMAGGSKAPDTPAK